MSTSTQLEWINLLEPHKRIPDRKLQKRIRSHITSQQHRRRRIAELNSTSKDSDYLSVHGSLISLADHNCTLRSPVLTTTDCDESDSSQISSEDDGSGNHASDENTRRPLINIFAMFDSHSTIRLLRDPTDELDLYTCRLGANVPDVLKYYDILVNRQGAKFRSMSSLPPPTSPTGPRLIPYLTTDPALLAAACLLVLSGMRSFNPHLMGSTEVSVLQLRLYVVGTIQAAVDAQAVSDQLILAVGLLGVYETIFGRPERYHVHSKGLRDMVKLHGGLQNLGLGGLIEALVLWYDANTASINGCVPYLDGLPRSSRFVKEGPKVDRDHFLCWVPDGELQQESLNTSPY